MTFSASISRMLLVTVIAGATILLALNRDKLDAVLVERLIRDLGVWAPIGHIALFALGTVLFAPGAIFGLLGGALFGPLLGTALNLVGATLGATAAFLVARHIGGDWVRRKAGSRIELFMSGVEAEGWRFVALMRLVPLVPFNLLNYALGLTRIPVMQYVFASLLAMVPGTLAFTWLGHAGRQALGGDPAAIRYGLLALGLLAAVAFLPRLVRRLRGGEAHRWIEGEDLARLLASKRGVTVIDVRAPNDFMGALGHIAGANNLPLAEIEQRLPELAPLKDQPVVLVCRTHKMSANAASKLEAEGFRDVRVLRGGMVQWNEGGRPVSDRSLAPQERQAAAAARPRAKH